MIDSKWAVACERADRAGKLLAQVLLKGDHGRRPVTLLGYSMGARVVMACLQDLANVGERAAGLVHSAVLMGTPVSSSASQWSRARSVVADRLVNVYSTKDWILHVVYRTQQLALRGVAGTAPIGVPGVEDVDASRIVKGNHQAYASNIREILRLVGLQDWLDAGGSSLVRGVSEVSEADRRG
jgi:pimeloyl-ACP methyl ester carboxylesterase